MTLKQGLLLGTACLLVGSVAGYCWQGKAASAALVALETRVVAYQADSAAFWSSQAARTDTVVQIRRVISGDSARAESLTTIIGDINDTLSVHRVTDSVDGATFDAYARAVATRDSLRLVTIKDLNRVISVQDSQLVGLRSRLTEANVLLAQAIGVARALDARASRRWHLALAGGYGCTLAGNPACGPTVSAGLAYTLF